MIPQRIPNATREDVGAGQVNALADRWGITCTLTSKLLRAAGMLPFDLQIFSGARSREQQEALAREGSGASWSTSTHADTDLQGCVRFATGADVQPTSPAVRLSRAAVLEMGAAMMVAGLRWGGGAPFDEHGIPVGSEKWHVDEGPRNESPR